LLLMLLPLLLLLLLLLLFIGIIIIIKIKWSSISTEVHNSFQKKSGYQTSCINASALSP
jgi:hypothetical protein